LLSITAVIAAIATWTLRKGLRAAAESLSLLTVLLVVVDFVAAVEGGLFGLGGVSDDLESWIAAGLVVITGLAWAVAARRTRTRMLMGVELVAALGVSWLVILAFEQHWIRTEFMAFLLAVVVAGVALAAARTAVWTFAAWVALIAGGNLAIAFLASLVRILDHDDLAGLWTNGRAVGWVVCMVVAAAIAATQRIAMPARIMSAAVAVLGVELLVLRPLEGSSDNLILSCVTAACAVAAASTLLLARPWRVGAAAGAVPTALISTVMVAPSAVYAVAIALSGAKRPWTWSISDRSRFQDFDPIASPWLVGIAGVLVAAAVFVIVVRRLPGLATAFVIVLTAAVVVALRYSMPLWGVIAILAAMTAATAAFAVVKRSWFVGAVALGSACITLTGSLGSNLTTLVVAVALALGLAALTWWVADNELSATAALGGVVLGGLAVAAGFDHAGLRENGTSYALVGFGALVVLAAQVRLGGRTHRSRPGTELGAVVVQTVGVALAVAYDTDLQTPIALTVAGASLAAVALVSEDRRPVSVVGGLLLAAATWVRLAAVGVTVVEAYTLPSATVLLVLGVIRMRRRPGTSSITNLAPGLLLALVPSLVVAIPDPTSLRALLLGIAAAAAILAGAAVRWACPLLVGGAVLLVLVIVNLAPYANAIPRWVLLALLCAAFLFLGITWEKRLRDARTLLAQVERLA
jgi:hypothetical protein